MYIRQKKSWELSENKVTPESVYLTRRKLIQQTGLAGFGLIMGSAPTSAVPIGGFPPIRNTEYTLDRTLTSEQDATTYTNFYEFGSSKNKQAGLLYIARASPILCLSPPDKF